MTFPIGPEPFSAELRHLLVASALPTEDLMEECSAQFYTSRSGDELLGAVGLELHGDAALLRSLAVARSARGRGLGTALVHHAEGAASTQHARSLYLLTTTAEGFFVSLGYKNLDRQLAPKAIAATREFSSICPSSSAFMMKRL